MLKCYKKPILHQIARKTAQCDQKEAILTMIGGFCVLVTYLHLHLHLLYYYSYFY